MRTIFTVWLGTLASVSGLFFTLYPTNTQLSGLQFILIGVVICGFLGMIGLDVRDHYRRQPKAYKNKNEINKYMYDWISKGGHVVIFSRDMSWASDVEIIKLLHRKAVAQELTICLPQNIEISSKLAESGARILTYSDLNYTPRSRFTIINKDRLDAKVAVGRLIGDKHVIEEFAEGEHPVFAIANDVIEILRRISS